VKKKGSQNVFKKYNNRCRSTVDFIQRSSRSTFSGSKNMTLFPHLNGGIYTMKEEQQPAKVNMVINAILEAMREKIVSVSSGATSSISNGKEIAFIFRGEVFVINGRRQTRITNTPAQERMIAGVQTAGHCILKLASGYLSI
jgi:tricorn protease-like protein